ncbi:Glycosyltransferase involved in cell wall bisynthesis [Paenibacillus sp. yr247]|uniref:methyltransferase domain-containing protein n=1 Tax=Paenibacillus sp. yr247 TaxID=1761880 RepID=UPI00088DF21C|nr:methyltransferase domain-containing protein [Paenibacillus sp. yr247]SDN35149.1 Glycosyltransferase involved in cell wall bisynthesis [Paenibacillus sp. yr247]
MTSQIYENESWWQQNGLGWADEVEKRRSLQPLYGIQEVVLSSFFSKMQKHTKVLEFGVGFGRHAEYLDEISNIEFYGVDQSPTMLESLKLRLQHKSDLLNRISLIEPRTKLPFPDGFFDFVFTVSVLIHIRPDHLGGILSELTRVSKNGIIHFENNFTSNSELKFPDHNGCWQHSIVQEYEKLGLACDLMTKAADEQDIYYTHLSGEWDKAKLESNVMFSRLHNMDQRIRPSILSFEGEIGWRTEELKVRIEKEFQTQIEIDSLKKNYEEEHKAKEILEKYSKDLQITVFQLNDEVKSSNEKLTEFRYQIDNERLLNEQLKIEFDKLRSQGIYLESRLHEIENSLAWRLITKLRGMDSFYRMSKPLRKIIHAVRRKSSRDSGKSVVIAPFSSHQENIIAEKKNNDLRDILSEIPLKSHISIYHPEWLGVSHSTKELFPFTLPIKELHDIEEVSYLTKLIYEREPLSITYSGFAIGYFQLAKSLKKLNPNISLKVLWHGNTTHMYEDYSWGRYQEIIQLCNEGILDGWGFAKESMAALYAHKGYPSFFINNTVNIDLERVKKYKKIQNERIRIGVYASGNTWNKNAFTQLAAVGLIDNSQVNAIPYTSRMKAFAEQLNIDFQGRESAVSRDELLSIMGDNDINLYVTFSECAPLLPLESMEMGVPCLTGPNHHYYKGSELESFLIVNEPDNPVEIARKIENVIKNRDLIMDLYQVWKKQNNEKSKQSIMEFLEGAH